MTSLPGWITRLRGGRDGATATTRPPFKLPRVAALVLAGAMAATALAAAALTPDFRGVPPVPPLTAVVPERFGDWHVVELPYVQVDTAVGNGERAIDQPYDDVLTRAYRNSRGEVVLLAVAYGRTQQQEIKVHRPELCYTAAGYQVVSMAPARFGSLPGASAPVVGKRMLTEGRGQVEAVSYWIRIGTLYSESAFETRMHILSEGLRGRVPDGVLVRASRIIGSPADAAQTYPALERFLAELAAAAPEGGRAALVR